MLAISVSRAILVSSLFLAIIVIGAHQVHAESLYEEIGSVISDVEYLYSKGVNVTPIIQLLNRAVESYSSGNVEDAYTYLQEARSQIELYKPEAESIYLRILAVKIVSVIILALIPILVYLLLPRVYLYLWFKLHRKWIIRW